MSMAIVRHSARGAGVSRGHIEPLIDLIDSAKITLSSGMEAPLRLVCRFSGLYSTAKPLSDWSREARLSDRRTHVMSWQPLFPSPDLTIRYFTPPPQALSRKWIRTCVAI